MLLPDMDLVSSPEANRDKCGNKEGTESKYKEVLVTSAVDGYDRECITEDATWGISLDVIPVISASDLLSLLIIQIHSSFYLTLTILVCFLDEL